MREQRLPEHGGDLDQALRRYGGCAQDWIDLSTGINRQPYPVVDLPFGCWTGLPSRSEIEALHDAARQAYGTEAPVLATAGAQAAIGLLPYLSPRGRARILAPTYNEYAAVLSGAGFDVVETDELETLAGADLAVVANPNNPDGRHYEAEHLLALLPRVGRLVVDESFADATCGLSLMPRAGQARLVILRSFGKFYGLAGLRLGFIAGSNADIAGLRRWRVRGRSLAPQSRSESALCSITSGQRRRRLAWRGIAYVLIGWRHRMAGSLSGAPRCSASMRRAIRRWRRSGLGARAYGRAPSRKSRDGCGSAFPAMRTNGSG